MQTYTQDFNDAIRAADREIRGYLEFNGDSTKQMHGADGLIQFTVHREMQNAERFCVGSVASSYCEASFFNSGIPAGVSLANSYFDAYVGVVLPDTTVEYKPLGRFFITEISRETETTAVVGYDEIAYKMDVPYTPTITAGVNGYKALDILNDIIDQTGCNGGTHYSGWNWYVPQLVEASCKDTFAWIVAANRSFATNLTTAYDYSGTTTVGSKPFNKATYTSYPAITDDVIYMDGLKLGDTFTISSYTTGTEDNPIVCGSGVGPNNPNPYINSTQANTIFADINGETYTPMTLHFRGDPCIMVNDCLKVTTGGVDYKCVPMRMVSTFNGGFEQTIDCWGDSEAYYEMSYSPTEAKIQTNNTLIKDIAQAIETARNGVITQILDTDGSWKELCISNNQDLSQATSVWRFNINGLAHSTAYQGGTYTFALDDQGRIVATLIQTGILQDALGKNSWNLDTGAFTITDGSINITTNSQTYDAISLTYNEWTASMAPLQFDLKNSSTKKEFLLQAGGIYGYSDYSTNKRDVLISADGSAWIGGGSNAGLLYLNNASANTTATLDGSTGKITLGGSTNGEIIVKNSSNANRIILTGSSGNITSVTHTLGSSSLGAGTMFVNNASNNSVIVLDGANAAITGTTLTLGGTMTSAGNIKINRGDGTNGMEFNPSLPAMIIKAANGTNYRTALSDDGLYFYNASGTLTAKYGNAILASTYTQITVGTAWTRSKGITIPEEGLYAITGTLEYNNAAPRGISLVSRNDSNATLYHNLAVNEYYQSITGHTVSVMRVGTVAYLRQGNEVWLYTKSSSSALNYCGLWAHKIA